MTKEKLIEELEKEMECYNKACPSVESCDDCPYCSHISRGDLVENVLKYLKES